ncbi:MAG: hypothetical protein WBE72_25490 [Terracidiphilus sp.]
MRLVKRARLLLALIPFLAGCGDFWQPPGGSSGSGGATTTTLSSGYFYVLNQATSQIVAYNITSGTLNQIGAYTLSAAPTAIAIAPGGGFLYVSSLTGIFLYTIGNNGALTVGNNGGAISYDPAAAIQVDSTGAWLVDAVQGTSGVTLDAIPINSSGAYSGATVGTVQYAVNNAAVHQLALSADDLHVFAALGAGGTLYVDFASGNANPLAASGNVIPVQNAGGSALSVAVDPSSSPRLLYIGEVLGNSAATSGGLRVINYSSLGGTPTQVTGSPFSSGGLGPYAILPVSTGDTVYVANGTGESSAGNIAGFSITSSNSVYTVATGSTVATGILPYGLAEDSNSNFVLAACEGGSYDLEAYIFDTTTAGQLDLAIHSTTGTGATDPIAVAAAP